MVRSQSGFTLVELLVAMGIMVILLALAAPGFSTYMANDRVRAAAASFYAGVQTTRTEAIRRNASSTNMVQIIWTSDPATPAFSSIALVSTAGPNWMVRYQPPGSATYAYITGHSAKEAAGSGGNNSVQVTASTPFLAFTGLGATTTGATATFAFTNPSAGACVANNGPVRCLNVNVSAAGQPELCDPSITDATDPKHCNVQ